MKNIRNTCIAAAIILLAGCKRDDYYVDGGLANPIFNGTVLEYLESKPQLDTIAQIVRLAGLEAEFNSEEFTFFAPSDVNIKRLIGQVNYIGNDPALTLINNPWSVNQALYRLSLDTIQTLADVDPAIWRKFLRRYMFRGKHKLMDYPQIDFAILNTFPGQNYYAYDNTVSNIGVVYHDAVRDEGKVTESRLKYMGYRQLYISYIPNLSIPNSFTQSPVASSDIQADNGIVHVIDFTQHQFGFNAFEIADDIIQSKR